MSSTLTAHELVQKNINLLSLPETALRINHMISDPRSTAADIGDVISQDPALTARLLRVVNSAFYGFPSQIDTISMAITVLGTRQLRDLVMTTSVINRFRDIPAAVVDMEHFWCHSLATAIAAKNFANHIKIGSSERLFVAGLLHDIGKLVMYITLPDPSRQVVEIADEPQVDSNHVERAVFGFSHAEVGAELLRQWKLPESLIEAVAFHHQPLLAEAYPQETAIVHLANVIANNIQPAISTDDDSIAEPLAWETLGLQATLLERLHEEVFQQLDDILNIFYYSHAA
ncbi:MAG: HDOD domain-containing protein [Gammaproteobacteria bacterium]